MIPEEYPNSKLRSTVMCFTQADNSTRLNIGQNYLANNFAYFDNLEMYRVEATIQDPSVPLFY